MKIQLYAIFDTCSGLYEKPHFATHDDIVKREFQDICVADDNPISRHPEHYSLYRLGIFDNTTGQMIDERNECLWTGHEAISQTQKLNGEEESFPFNKSLDPMRHADSVEDAHALVAPEHQLPTEK